MTEELESRLRSRPSDVADKLVTPSGRPATCPPAKHKWAPRVALVAVAGLLAGGGVLLSQRANDRVVRPGQAEQEESDGARPTDTEVAVTVSESIDEPALVTILVFSGRPNPEWEPTPAQSTQLQTAVDELTRADSAGERHSILGFNGFAVTNFHSSRFDGTLSVSEDMIACECSPDDSTVLLADPDGSVFRLLSMWSLEQPLDPVVRDVVLQHR